MADVEKQRLIEVICSDINDHGLEAEKFTELKARLQLTSVDVLRRIAGSTAVTEAFAYAAGIGEATGDYEGTRAYCLNPACRRPITDCDPIFIGYCSTMCRESFRSRVSRAVHAKYGSEVTA